MKYSYKKNKGDEFIINSIPDQSSQNIWLEVSSDKGLNYEEYLIIRFIEINKNNKRDKNYEIKVTGNDISNKIAKVNQVAEPYPKIYNSRDEIIFSPG